MDGLTLDRHKVVPVLNWLDLTEQEKKEYCIGDSDGMFFRYLGNIYSDRDFMISHDPDWDGYLSDTFFSGIFMKFEDDFEKVHCMRYFS